jgi:hypothetical protein
MAVEQSARMISTSEFRHRLSFGITMGEVKRVPICLRLGVPMARGFDFLPNKATTSIYELQEENARLKDLVVTLSSLVLKNVVHEPKSNIHDLASRDHIFPRSKAEEQEIAEALEAAGHELMAKASEMKLILKRQKRPPFWET